MLDSLTKKVGNKGIRLDFKNLKLAVSLDRWLQTSFLKT